MVWRDFRFACAAYAEEEPLRGEVVAEAREAVTRLTPHPSLVLWNGCNENIWGHEDWGWKESLGDLTWAWGTTPRSCPPSLPGSTRPCRTPPAARGRWTPRATPTTRPTAPCTSGTCGTRPTAHGGSPRVDGRRWRFAGTNTYYLHEQSHYMIDSVLNDAAAMSLTVVRAWAYIDGPAHNGRSLQPRPHVHQDQDFDSLDYAVHKAGTLGQRLVLPLVNNWPDYGGMQQYVAWCLGLPDNSYGASVNHDRFYTDPRIREAYRTWAQHVTHHRNPYPACATTRTRRLPRGLPEQHRLGAEGPRAARERGLGHPMSPDDRRARPRRSP
jgi:hypothetical protein